jgi:hypothetical protein
MAQIVDAVGLHPIQSDKLPTKLHLDQLNALT